MSECKIEQTLYCSLGIVGLILVEREKKIKIMGTYRLVDSRLVTTYRSKENFSSNLSKWGLNHQNDDQSCQKRELGRESISLGISSQIYLFGFWFRDYMYTTHMCDV